MFTDIYLLGLLIGVPLAMITSPLIIRFLERLQDKYEIGENSYLREE